MQLEDLLDRLERVEKRQGYYVSRCPAHEDGIASLSIREAEDGKLLVRCHAGCTYESIIAALGVTSLSGGETTDDEAEVVYTYTDENGTPLFESVRLAGKKFRQRHISNGEYVWGLKDVRRVLYRLPEVLEQAFQNKLVIVCEGEKDVEALREAGQVATCNPMGAGKWLDEYSQCLVGASVVIVVDKDEPGRKHAKQVKESLKKHGIEAKLLQAKKGKDAHDHLKKHGYALNDFVPVRDGRMPGVVTSAQMADNALVALEARPETTFRYNNPWNLPEPEFAPGRLYIIGGWTGGGKSSILGDVFRHLAQGGVRVGLITNEMVEADYRNRLLCHKGFKLKELEKPWDMSDAEKARLRAEIEVMRAWDADIIFDTGAGYKQAGEYLEDGGYDFLCFDHISRTPSATSGEEAQIGNEIRGFTNLALDFNIPIFVVGQLRRPMPGVTPPRPSIHDFKGSGAIEQEAAMALSVFAEKGKSTELNILKNRHGSRELYYLDFIAPQFRFEKARTLDGQEAAKQIWG